MEKDEKGNLYIFEKVKEVPENAKSKITGGKLNKFTDIKPIWRIQKLTEIFGPVGKGWYTEIIDRRKEEGPDGRIAIITDINLYVKYENEWSKPIFGTGGSMLVDIEKGKHVLSDEAYKMSHTDAISVCCRSLGIGADVYYGDNGKPETKYQNTNKEPDYKPIPQKTKCPVCGREVPEVIELKHGKTTTGAAFVAKYGKCMDCLKKEKRETQKPEPEKAEAEQQSLDSSEGFDFPDWAFQKV